MKQSESQSAAIVENTEFERLVQCPADATAIDFDHIKSQRPEMWEDGLTIAMDGTIKKGGRPDLFLVDHGEGMIENCSLSVNEPYGHRGWCSCQVFPAEGVCPHLCAIRQTAAIDQVTLPSLKIH